MVTNRSIGWLVAGVALAASVAFALSRSPGDDGFRGAGTPQPIPAARPVVVGLALVDPTTGNIVGKIERGAPYGISEPLEGQSGKFHHHGRAMRTPTGLVPPVDLVVDTNTFEVTTDGVLVEDDDQVRRLGPDAAETWSFEIGSVRPPASAEIDGVVMIATDDGLIGVNAGTGARLWKKHRFAPSSRLAVGNGVVVAVGGTTMPDDGDLIVAYHPDGSEAWRGALPHDSDPARIIVAGDSFLVGQGGFASEPSWSRIFSSDGTLRCANDDERIVDAVEIVGSRDLLVAGSRGLARITPDCEDVWRMSDPRDDFREAVGFASIDGRNFLIEMHDDISDSGVALAKLDASDGTIAWRVQAAALRVPHSAYYQFVYLEPRGTEFVVVSQASGGHFVERRSLADGALLLRTNVDHEAP